MGDPYGLVQDESDMLIHPAMIRNTSDTRFYTHYRYTYADVMDWDYKWNFDISGLEVSHHFEASGDEHKHEALIGSALNLGSGRGGVFLLMKTKAASMTAKSAKIFLLGMAWILIWNQTKMTLL